MSRKCFLNPEFDRAVPGGLSWELAERQIIQGYEKDLLSCFEIASLFQFNVTRQHVYKFLKRRGIDTSKRRIEVECYWCEVRFDKTRKRYRACKRHFCSDECYDIYLSEIGMDRQDNFGDRIARSVVSQHFELQEDNIIHHEDKKRLNNIEWNLKVFANGRDHIRYHRGVIKIAPLWDGAKEHLHI